MDERKPYVSPEMEITVFDTEDVITTSNDDVTVIIDDEE